MDGVMQAAAKSLQLPSYDRSEAAQQVGAHRDAGCMVATHVMTWAVVGLTTRVVGCSSVRVMRTTGMRHRERSPALMRPSPLLQTPVARSVQHHPRRLRARASADTPAQQQEGIAARARCGHVRQRQLSGAGTKLSRSVGVAPCGRASRAPAAKMPTIGAGNERVA